MVSFCKQSHVLKASLLFLLNYLETGRGMTILPPELLGTGRFPLNYLEQVGVVFQFFPRNYLEQVGFLLNVLRSF